MSTFTRFGKILGLRKGTTLQGYRLNRLNYKRKASGEVVLMTLWVPVNRCSNREKFLATIFDHLENENLVSVGTSWKTHVSDWLISPFVGEIVVSTIAREVKRDE